MLWFGRTWDAPICMECDQVETPIGSSCSWCEETIAPDDRGIVYENGPVAHLECFFRQTIGSIAHIQKRCSCFVKDSKESDPPELSKREAAKLAVELWEEENEP